MQLRGKPVARSRGDVGDRHAFDRGEVDEHLADAARIEHRGDAALGRTALVRHQHHGRGHLLNIVDAGDAVAVEHRLIGRVVARDGARMADRQRGALGGAPDLEDDDGHVARARLLEPGDEALGVAHGLEEHRDQPRRGPVERIIEVIGRGRHQLLARRDGEVVAQPVLGLDQRPQERARMGHQRDVAGLAMAARRIARRAGAGLEIIETDAVAATHLHAGVLGDVPDPLGQRRLGIALVVARGEHRGGARADLGGGGELRLDARVGDRDDDVIDRPRQIGERGVAGQSLDRLVLRIDRVDRPLEAVRIRFLDHLVADAVGPCRGADEGHRTGRQERCQAVLDRDGRGVVHDRLSTPSRRTIEAP